MSDQRRQILQMLADAKINADEAERLLSALEKGASPAAETTEYCAESGKKPKFLHIQVQDDKDNVDIKIPIMLVKAGMKLGTLVPEKAKGMIIGRLGEQGLDINLNQLNSENIESIIKALTESSIDIHSDKEKVRIYCC